MSKRSETFSAEEKAAMKEAAKERKAGTGLQDLLAKIAEMEGLDREIAEGLHTVVGEVAPDLAPRTWYGMPAYAKGGKVLCFMQPAGKFKARYATIGFNDVAALDDGDMWPASFAVVAWNADVADRVAELVRRAVG
jgi:uncharacterized protein YdhG (YjbR/CyaY superfamily)